MKKNTAWSFLIALLCGVSPAQSVTFDWATVGNPGNADDTHGAGHGGVDYTYRISKHEVTNAQYTKFLNAVDPMGSNSLQLYRSNMSSHAGGGINFNGGAANGLKYESKSGRDNNPVVYLSFFDAMRFTNWLENGQGTGDTESGVYTIGSGTDEVRNPNATFFIPSEDEWYKAAYHRNDGVTGNYWDYPTSTDTVPYSDNPSSLNTPDDRNVANFFKNDNTANSYDDGYAVTGSTSLDFDQQNYLTDVGAYSLATSPYGTFDQGGNVWEWNEAVISSSFRGLRGGHARMSSGELRATSRRSGNPAVEFSSIGFRVATIPLVGDFDFSNFVGAADIDLLTEEIRNSSTDLAFDLDGSTIVDAADVAYLVETLIGTHFGDADLNAAVTASGDGAVLLANLGGVQGNKGWADADFDGDQNVTASADGATLLTNLGNDATAVPEPSSLLLAAMAAVGLLMWRRRSS